MSRSSIVSAGGQASPDTTLSVETELFRERASNLDSAVFDVSPRAWWCEVVSDWDDLQFVELSWSSCVAAACLVV
jgi:hypothetical protein